MNWYKGGFFALLLFGTFMFGNMVARPATFCGTFNFPCWSTSARPSTPGAGTVGFNTTTLSLEFFNGLAWAQAGAFGTMSHQLTTASTNARNWKTSAGLVPSLSAINTTGTIYYLKFYDVAGTPTCNTDTVIGTYPIPATPASTGSGIATLIGATFSNGIGTCVTGGIADNDNTNAAAGVAITLVVN